MQAYDAKKRGEFHPCGDRHSRGEGGWGARATHEAKRRLWWGDCAHVCARFDVKRGFWPQEKTGVRKEVLP